MTRMNEPEPVSRGGGGGVAKAALGQAEPHG